MNEIEKKYFDAFVSFVKNEMSFENIDDFDGFTNSKTKCTTSFEQMLSNIDKGILGFSLSINKSAFTKGVYEGSCKEAFILDCNKETFDTNGYIPDFRIRGSNFYTFVIEIDGHEWHEKTKEQAAKDRQKDRVYLKNLEIPIRFTGSEVYHDPTQCVKETLEILSEFEIHSRTDFSIKL